jgi:hypothetical protein
MHWVNVIDEPTVNRRKLLGRARCLSDVACGLSLVFIELGESRIRARREDACHRMVYFRS